MKIVIDARLFGPKHFTGIGRYIEELVLGLEKLDRDNDYVVLLGRKNFDLYRPASPNFTKMLVPYPHYSVAEQLLMPWVLYRLRPDLVHFPHFNLPLLYIGRRVTTIHDLTTILYASRARPGLLGRLKQLKRLPAQWLFWWAAKTSQAVITPTEYVKAVLVERYHLPLPRVTVTLEGIPDRLLVVPAEPKLLPKHPFLFYIGTYYPHKNIARLVDAFAVIVAKRPSLQLVLAGKVDYTYEAVRAQVHLLGLSDKVVFAGYVTEGELAWYYAHAESYVFPSLSEGFGLPGLEAMSYGTPVIAARASCLPEVYGEAAAYMAPDDTAAMAADILSVINDPGRLEDLSQAGYAQIHHFSWEQMARLTLAVYRSVR